MIKTDTAFGRLGNKLFCYATLYALARDKGIPTEASPPYFPYYLQNPELFEKYEAEIKQIFGYGIGNLPRTAIHVRRGDYVGSNFHSNLSETDYYDRAIAMFPNEKFVVFSDDPGWCRKKWGDDERFKILDMGDEIEDFNLQSSCQNQIISNSSYSFWAAYLNPNPSKKVVAPRLENYFKDGKIRGKLPREWIMI